MRTLARNKRVFYYMNFASSAMLTDSDGNYGGEEEITYSKAKKVRGYITAARGDAESVEFGTDLQYDKTIILEGIGWDITENSMLYIDDLDLTHDPDYKVIRIAEHLNHTTLAVAKVAR